MSQSEFDSALPNGIGLAPYLRMKQEGMTENESRIVEWLLKPGNLSCAPAIKDVAEALAVSEAMIVKVSKLLGFSGFRNLRSALEDYFSQSSMSMRSTVPHAFSIRQNSAICMARVDRMLSALTYNINFYALAYAVRPIPMRTS